MQFCSLHHTKKTTGCYMKKIGLNIQLFLHSAACFAGFQNFISLFIFSNVNHHLLTTCLKSKKLDVFNNVNDLIPGLINKNETQSFQLPK